MVKLRFKRFGRTNSPFYRLCAMDSRRPRNGKAIEELGHFDPSETDTAKAVQFNAERIKHWISVGAQPSETVRDLLAKVGIIQKPVKKYKVKKQAEAPVAEAKTEEAKA